MRVGQFCSLLALVGVLPSAITAAEIGTLTGLVSSSMDGGAQDLDQAANGVLTLANTTVFPITIPVTVRFSTTTGGVDGTNSGAAGLFLTLTGSAVGDNTGSSMVLNNTFKKHMGFSSVTGSSSSIVNWTGPQGLGFDLQSSTGTGGVGGIENFGGFQSLPDQMDFGYLDAQYAGHPAGEHPTVATNAGLPLTSEQQYEKAVGPVIVATGTLVIGGFGDITLEGSGVLWAAGGGAMEIASFAGDVLTVAATAIVAADFDADGDVDGFDFLTFANCYNGSNQPPLTVCQNPGTDLEGDGDVDGFDFLTFSNCYNGSARLPLCQ